MGKVSEYSSLKPEQCEQVKEFLEKFKYENVIDAFAHIGCDTLNFSDLTPVTAYEIDDKTREALIANTLDTIHPVEVKGEFTMCPIDKGTLLYLDPPWGGRGCSDPKSVDSQGSTTPLSDYIEYYKNNLIMCKVPRDYKIPDGAISYDIYTVWKGGRKLSYKLFIIDGR